MLPVCVTEAVLIPVSFAAQFPAVLYTTSIFCRFMLFVNML